MSALGQSGHSDITRSPGRPAQAATAARPPGSIRVPKGRERFAQWQDRRRQARGAREYGPQQASVPHCLLLPSKRIGRTKVRSVSGTAAGGGGNGAARVIRESASASSTAEPELLMI